MVCDLVRPVLFAAGMSLFDTLDGSFINFAYRWVFCKPVRKVHYNISLTGLSVMVARLIGTAEVLGLIASEYNLTGPFWGWVAGRKINTLGFIIVGLFVAPGPSPWPSRRSPGSKTNGPSNMRPAPGSR